MSDDSLKKDEQVAGVFPNPIAMPFGAGVVVGLLYAFTHPWKLVGGMISAALGLVASAIVWGFASHMVVDGFTWSWNLWEKI